MWQKKLTEQEILDTYKEMQERYGDDLPNFEHEPRRFAYYVKLFNYTKERNEAED